MMRDGRVGVAGGGEAAGPNTEGAGGVNRMAGAVGAIALAAGLAIAQPVPRFTIEALPGASGAINNHDEVTLVVAYDASREIGGVLDLSTGGFRALTVAMHDVALTDITDTGFVAGYVGYSSGARYIVQWTPEGKRNNLPRVYEAVTTGPFLNDSGRVVWGDGDVASTWATGTRVWKTGSLAAVSRSMRGITNDNMVLGMWRGQGVLAPLSGRLVSAPATDSTIWNEAIEANAHGDLLVSCAESGGLRQFIWHADAVGTDGEFELLADPASWRIMTMSRAMNDLGDVVGAGVTPGVYIPDSMLWTAGTGYSFRELLGGAYPEGWTGFLMPVDINNRGTILGVGTFEGEVRWFVMRPGDEWAWMWEGE